MVRYQLVMLIIYQLSNVCSNRIDLFKPLESLKSYWMLILNPCIINQAPMYVYTAILSFGISCSWQLCLGFVLIHKHILRWSWLIEFPVICLSVIPIWMFMISFAKYWISMVACSSYSLQFYKDICIIVMIKWISCHLLEWMSMISFVNLNIQWSYALVIGSVL